ncbi:unnamed protein product [Caenorhabditis sp. 36 PRJEB53466]|nr:unnamed protein product [Caenorhabditis sp. 36 PRJEB53466]
MRFLILLTLFSTVISAPQLLSEEEFPFSTDNFPTFLDEANSSSAEEKDELALSYADQAETLKKRLKMKSMFNANGPPAIGSNLFSNAAVEENTKKLSYEGSGAAIEENSEKSAEVLTTSSTSAGTTIDYFSSANNSSMEDSFVEASSNSSILYDQNTSDAEVETISDTVYQKNQAAAVLQASEDDDDNKVDEENAVEVSNVKTVLDIGDNDANETTSKISCPSPPMCGKNCFVTINEKGCQDCQCLWIAADCDTDKDCYEKNQYCDLGKCNCQPGYQQNMRKSGVCEVDPFVKKSTEYGPPETESNDLEENANNLQELRRNKRNSKPRRSERLEWPEDENTKKISFDTDEIRTSRPNEEIVPSITVVPDIIPTDIPRRGISRFVSVDFAKQLQRTTAKVKKYDWFPPTTTIATVTSPFTSTTDHVPPITVDQFFMIETTVAPPPTPSPTTEKKVFNDHKMEYMKERKPNFLGVKEEVHDMDYPISLQSHIKKIHLEMPPSLLPLRSNHKRLRTTTSIPDDASEIEDLSGVDEIEFPISSKIKNGFMKPRALSAEPTREELKDHKSLIELFNSHALKNEEETNTVKPSFQILQSFNNPEPLPDIQVSLATEDPTTKFSPIPDLHLEETRTYAPKPYIIQKRNFERIAPLSNISGDMASDDPPETTPESAPFRQHRMGVWYPMKKGDIPHLGIFSGEFRRSPRKKIKTPDDLRLYNEYTKANRQNRPIRIEMDNAADYVRNECQEDKNCGSRTVCCSKKWCDRTNNCGVGKFCLPSCDSTKLTFLPFSNHAESVIDIMYD